MISNLNCNTTTGAWRQKAWANDHGGHLLNSRLCEKKEHLAELRTRRKCTRPFSQQQWNDEKDLFTQLVLSEIQHFVYEYHTLKPIKRIREKMITVIHYNEIRRRACLHHSKYRRTPNRVNKKKLHLLLKQFSGNHKEKCGIRNLPSCHKLNHFYILF